MRKIYKNIYFWNDMIISDMKWDSTVVAQNLYKVDIYLLILLISSASPYFLKYTLNISKFWEDQAYVSLDLVAL